MTRARLTLALAALGVVIALGALAVIAGQAVGAATTRAATPTHVEEPAPPARPRTLDLDLPVDWHHGTDAGLITTPAA